MATTAETKSVCTRCDVCAAIACDTFQTSAALGLSLDVVRVWDLGNYFFSFPFVFYTAAPTHIHTSFRSSPGDRCFGISFKKNTCTLYYSAVALLFGCSADFSCFVAMTSVFASGIALHCIRCICLRRFGHAPTALQHDTLQPVSFGPETVVKSLDLLVLQKRPTANPYPPASLRKLRHYPGLAYTFLAPITRHPTTPFLKGAIVSADPMNIKHIWMLTPLPCR